MKKARSQRIFELDFLRGIALILMCLDHLAYDFYCLPYWFPLSDSPVIAALGRFGDAVAFSDWRQWIHYCFSTLFLLLAGVGSSLTRSPFRRFVKVALAAVAITVATVLLDLFFQMGVTILFGVLSAMAVGALFCWVCSLFGEKAGKWIALCLGVAAVVAGFCLRWYSAPILKFFGSDDLWSILLGTARYGADWFPVFPCSGVVLIGYFLGKILYREKRSLIPALEGKNSFLCAVGRKSLWIYLFHQPVLVGLLYLFVWIFIGD